MESTEIAGLSKETNAKEEFAEDSTPSQTSRVIHFPALSLKHINQRSLTSNSSFSNVYSTNKNRSSLSYNV